MKSILVLTAAMIVGDTTAAPPMPPAPVDASRAPGLVRQLASPRFREREKAAADLVLMGRAAKTALLAGTAHPDPEVQSRCRQLLPRALALDLQFRIDRFLADTEGKLDHDLPLWKAYQEKVGSDANARTLFADMLKANGSLLETAADEPAKLTERVQQRYMEMYTEMFGNPFGGIRIVQPGQSSVNAAETCALLFAASQPAYRPVQPDWMLSNLYNQPGFTTPLKDEKKGTAHRTVFFNFLDARMDDNTLNQSVWMLCQHRIQGGADVIARALKNGKATQVYAKASALCCIGTLGGKQHLDVFKPFLDDDTQVQPFFVGPGQRGHVKVRDVALAMTIHLSGKNPKDYGFTMWHVYPNQLIQYHQLGFGSDEDRAAAFKKWHDQGAKDPAKTK